MVRVGVAITTYNDIEMTTRLLESIIANTEFDEDYALLVFDDGTPNEAVVSALETLCMLHGVDFARHERNKGIPAAWNSCVRTLRERHGCEFVVLLNNDLIVPPESKNWLRCLVYFLENNECWSVGLPLIQADAEGRPLPYDPSSWGDKPTIVGAAVGCSFGVKFSVWQKLKQPDGSVGFFESLRSFHEEVDAGFEAARLGYYSFMLPGPPLIHLGGRTFARNPELLWMEIPDSKKVGVEINLDEYVECIKRSKLYPGEVKKVILGKIGEGVVDRMSFTRYVFAKKWGVPLEDYDDPAIVVHNRLVKGAKQRVKWLDPHTLEAKEDEAVAP